MQRLEVSGAVRLIYRSLGVKGLILETKSGFILAQLSLRAKTIIPKWIAFFHRQTIQ